MAEYLLFRVDLLHSFIEITLYVSKITFKASSTFILHEAIRAVTEKCPGNLCGNGQF